MTTEPPGRASGSADERTRSVPGVPGIEIEYTPEQVKMGRKTARQRRIIRRLWANLPLIRFTLFTIGAVWVLLLPEHALWKGTYVDEHALMPAGAKPHWDWSDVHRADNYLASVEALENANATWEERAEFLETTFKRSGLEAGRTPGSVYALVSPPRSEGVEAILISANWISRDMVPNVRGVSFLLAFGDFLRGKNHYAFDIYLVVGDGYLEGLTDFMATHKPRANIWTGINIDYPYHSFKTLGLYYEGVNGRLPNQDILNVASRVARHGGADPGVHDFDPYLWPTYWTALDTLLAHFKYAALGRPSAAHGVLSPYRIDAFTYYGVPAEGPHGFYSLGKTVDGAVRSVNNLLERLHASFFFYLMPSQDWFIPVGLYLPAAILIGASVTLGGFDIPDPLAGALWFIPPFLLAWMGWYFQSPLVAATAPILPKPTGAARQSLRGLAHLLYGALIPTLAMVNFPQAILLAATVVIFLLPMPRIGKMVVAGLNPALLSAVGIDLRAEWELFGNVTWPALFVVWMPLAAVSAMT